jgi:hypothetical protein
MSYKDVMPGEKIAKPIGARFIKSEKGTLGMEVAFRFKNVSPAGLESEEQMNWVGWMSEKAIENTMDTLANVLGFNGDDTIDPVTKMLTHPKALAYDQEVKLVIENETYEGKVYPKIKWVNRIGGSAFASVGVDTIKADLNAIGFKAAFLAAKQGAPAQSQAAPRNTINEADLPF